MQHTTRETTYKLHHAGFPEPMPEAGQCWWHPAHTDPILCVGPSETPGEYTMVMPGPRLESCGADFFVSAVFAPTATDILREDHFLCREISYKTSKGYRWVVYHGPSGCLFAANAPETDNPAEAAAMARLEAEENEENT